MTRRGRPPTAGRETMTTAALQILRERGLAKLTTREVASRAGVSEGSIFRHFGDRQGLLTAVFEDSLRPLFALGSAPPADPPRTLAQLRAELESWSQASAEFLEAGLDVLLAAHGDAGVRDEVTAFMAAQDYGPQRGAERVRRLLDRARADGVVAADADTAVVAYLLVSTIFQRSAQPKLVGHSRGIVASGDVLDTVMTMLTPRAGGVS